eukprot:scaffold217908_cov35-Prasinocladus_malaysianus.AAC.1
MKDAWLIGADNWAARRVSEHAYGADADAHAGPHGGPGETDARPAGGPLHAGSLVHAGSGDCQRCHPGGPLQGHRAGREVPGRVRHPGRLVSAASNTSSVHCPDTASQD